jgi:hypothetical protein
MVDGRWELGVGSWELGDGRWELEDGRRKMGVGRRKMVDGGRFYGEDVHLSVSANFSIKIKNTIP